MKDTEFANYKTIMYEDTSKNDVVNTIIDNYYNKSMIDLSTNDLKKINEIKEIMNSSSVATETSKIVEDIIIQESLGNLYDYIKGNSPTSVFNNVGSYLLSQYTFKPKIVYDQYIRENNKSLGFNNLRSASKEYNSIVGPIINANLTKCNGVFKSMVELMSTSTAGLKNIPCQMMIGYGMSDYIFDEKLDQVFLSSLNGSLFTISESGISKFFRVLANLNYYIIKEKLEEFNDILSNNLNIGMHELISSLTEYKNLTKKDERDEYFDNLSDSSAVLWKSICNFVRYNKFDIDDIYPGMYLPDTFRLLEDILTSDHFTLDSVENISLFTIYRVCKGYFNISNNKRQTEFITLKNSAIEFNSIYYKLRKAIINNGRFNYTVLDSDES